MLPRLRPLLFIVALVFAVGTAGATGAAPARHALATELLGALRSAGVQHTVIAESDDALDLAIGEARPHLALDNLERQLDAAGPDKPARARVLARWVDALKQLGAPKAALDKKRIYPRLLHPSFGAGNPAAGEIVRAPWGQSALDLAFVVDMGSSFRYVVKQDLDALALSRAELERLAVENLAADLPRAKLRPLVASRQFVLSQPDGHAATRLLLVAREVQRGERLAVWAPHRDLLLVMPAPATDAEWQQLTHKLRAVAEQARADGTSAASPPLLDRLLLVTADGVSVR